MTTAPTNILAYASEDAKYDHVRRAALETAKSAHARLILYDIDAAGFVSPMPTGWSSDGEKEQFADMLSPDDLERAGRHPIAEQVKEARDQGVDAFGWLPDKKGADALAAYCDEHEVDLVMMPADLEEPGVFDRLRGASVDKAKEKTGRPIAVVDEDGEVHYR